MRSLKIFLISSVTVLQSLSIHAAEPLSIKGRGIGQSAESACVGASDPIVEMDQLLEKARTSYPDLKPVGSSSCEVSIPTFAGQPVATPMHLLFYQAKLIQIKFSTAGLDLSQTVDFFTATEAAYGKTKPFVRNKATGFSTRTWRQGNQTLELTKPPTSDPIYAEYEVVLRDTVLVDKVLKAMAANKEIANRTDAQRRKDDTR